MLFLQGMITNVFNTPKGVNRDTGEVYGGQSKIQVMSDNIMKNGEKRMDMINLTVDNPDAYRPYVGKPAEIPVTVFIMNGALMYMVPPGSKPIAARAMT